MSTLRVVKNSQQGSIKISQGSQAQGSVVVKKSGALTVQSLSNVDTTNLQDGYTLVYDSTTNLWIAQPVEAGSISQVDGGTY